mmetsp:Transcript_1985/g.2820  ORF Transcript_1985/g.2820 Transcript_1985/m.2820 type:complete len:947 (-) Transcript_1985:117-2957(-)
MSVKSLAALSSLFHDEGPENGNIDGSSLRKILALAGIDKKTAEKKVKALTSSRKEDIATFQDFCQLYVRSCGEKPVIAIQRQFEIMDSDFDGKISLKEMKKHFANEYEHLDLNSVVVNLFASMDKNRSEFIFFDELKDWYTQKVLVGKEKEAKIREIAAAALKEEKKVPKTKEVEKKKEDKPEDKKVSDLETKLQKAKDPKNWGVEGMCKWLTKNSKTLGVTSMTIEQLRAEECDGSTFLELNKAMLRHLDLSIGQTTAVLEAIRTLKSTGPGKDWMKKEPKKPKKILVPGTKFLPIRQNMMHLSHVLSESKDKKDDLHRLKHLRKLLQNIIQYPESEGYRKLSKDFEFPIFGIYQQDNFLPMAIELFLKNADLERHIMDVVGRGYQDVEFLLFLEKGSKKYEWMESELKEVLESLKFTTYDQQIFRSHLRISIKKSAARSNKSRGRPLFHVGQKVQYRSRTRGDWHHAVVKNVRADGSCLVKLRAGAVKIAAPNMLRDAEQKAKLVTSNTKTEVDTKVKSEMDVSDGEAEKKESKNSAVGEVIIRILRSLGFQEDERTGFWLQLERNRVGMVSKAEAEIALIESSAENFIKTHTTVVDEKKEVSKEGKIEEEEEEESELTKMPKLVRQLSTRSVCHEAFKDALRYASGLYGSVSKEWVLGCLQNLHMLHKEAMSEMEKRTILNSPKNEMNTTPLLPHEVSNKNTDDNGEIDKLRLQLEQKFAQDLENEKGRLFQASMGIINHAQQKGNVAQLPEEKEAIFSGRMIRIKLFPSSTFDIKDPGQYHFRLAESQFFRMMGKQANNYKVQQVEYIVNPKLIKEYNSYKSQLISKGIIGVKKPVEERLSFHGTRQDVLELIVKGGFKIGGQDVAIASGAAYGQGVYTSEEPTFALHYIKTSGCNSLLFCKTLICPSTTIVPNYNGDSIQQIISPNKYQVLPCYLVHFSGR